MIKSLQEMLADEQEHARREADLRARSDSPDPRTVLEVLGIDWDTEVKAMRREGEKLALEELAKPRKRKIRRSK